MGQQVEKNPYGALGRFARFRQPADIWLEVTEERLEKVYGNNPHKILGVAEQLINSKGIHDFALHGVVHDYAAYWLSQKLRNAPSPTLEKQQDFLGRSLVMRDMRDFDWVHLELGWDIAAMRFGDAGNTLLTEHVSRHGTQHVPRLMAAIAPEQRVDYINQRNDYGWQAVHLLPMSAPGSALLDMQKAGAQLDAPVVFAPTPGVKMEGTLAHIAVMKCALSQVAMLAQFKPDLFKPDRNGDTAADAGQMQLETVLEDYGRGQAKRLVIGAFTAIASKGELVAMPRPNSADEQTAEFCAQLARCVNVAAHVAGRVMPYPEYSEEAVQLLRVPAPRVASSRQDKKLVH